MGDTVSSVFTCDWVTVELPWSVSLSSACLYRAVAATSRATCSRLNLVFTSFNSHGPTGFLGMKEEGRNGTRQRQDWEWDDQGRGRHERRKGRIQKVWGAILHRLVFHKRWGASLFTIVNLDPSSSTHGPNTDWLNVTNCHKYFHERRKRKIQKVWGAILHRFVFRKRLGSVTFHDFELGSV